MLAWGLTAAVVVLGAGDIARSFYHVSARLGTASNYLEFLVSLLGLYGLTALLLSVVGAATWAALSRTSPVEQVAHFRQWLVGLWSDSTNEPRRGAAGLVGFAGIVLSFVLDFYIVRHFVVHYNKASLIALAASAVILVVNAAIVLVAWVLFRAMLLLNTWHTQRWLHARTVLTLAGMTLAGLAVFAIARERQIFKSLDGWALYFPVMAAFASAAVVTFVPRAMVSWVCRRSWTHGLAWAAVFLVVCWGFFVTAARPRIRAFMVSYARNANDVTALWTRLTDFDGDGYTFLFGGGDCKPFDPRVHAGALDIPDNGLDEDCFDGDLHAQPTKPAVVNLTHPYKSVKHPNILMFSMDACRRDELGVYGAPANHTPNIDRWARKNAVVFNDAVSEASWTMPSFSALMTGRYAAEMKGFFGASKPTRIPRDIPRIAQVFKAAGYRTEAITSGLELKAFGLTQGFQKWVPVSRSPRGQFSVKVAEAGVKFLKQQVNGHPFFLWLHCIDPHAPYMPPGQDRLFGKKPAGLYAAEVHFADRAFGLVLKALRETHLDQDTIVVIFADHGEAFGEHGKYYHGMSTYAEEIRVPFIFYVPQVQPRRVRGLVGLIDLAPTLWDLAGIDHVKTVLRGVSLAPVIVEGNNAPDLDYLVEQTRYTQEFSLVTRRYHLRYDLSHNIFELFDRQKDPKEQHNLAYDRPKLLLKLRRKLVKKMTPVLLAITGRVKKALLTRIPAGYHRVHARFIGGPAIKAVRLTRRMHRGVDAGVVLQAQGPLKGKHFYLKLEVFDTSMRLSGRSSEPVAHNDYVPSLWRHNDLILHQVHIRSKRAIGSGPARVCVQFIIDHRVLKTGSGHTKACFAIPVD